MSDLDKKPLAKNIPLAPSGHKPEEPYVIEEEKAGFLPIETNWFDRLFISVIIWVALSLFWLRFIEPFGLSIWITNIVGLIMTPIIIKKG